MNSSSYRGLDAALDAANDASILTASQDEGDSKFLRLRNWVGIPLASAFLMLAPGFSRHHLLVNSLAADSVPAARSLDLNAQRDSEGVRFTWNRSSPPILEALRGVVWIKDGLGEWRLDIDKRKLAGGSLAYWPVSNDVTFRLEVISDSKIVSESVRSYADVSKPLSAEEPVTAVAESAKGSELLPMQSPKKTKAVHPATRASEEVFVAAKPIAKVKAAIPAALRNSMLGDEAVDLRVYINAEGSVFRTEILPGRADNSLLNAAADAAKRWRFEPARIGARPVESKVLLHFTFNDPL